jgi:hypothetical protein
LYGSWIYNYPSNQCLSPLMLWVRISFGRGVFNITLCDKVCQWLVSGRWFSLCTPVSSTNKTDSHDITGIVESGVKHPNPWHFTIIIHTFTYKLTCGTIRRAIIIKYVLTAKSVLLQKNMTVQGNLSLLQIIKQRIYIWYSMSYYWMKVNPMDNLY